jgi:hypothetical protein
MARPVSTGSRYSARNGFISGSKETVHDQAVTPP